MRALRGSEVTGRDGMGFDPMGEAQSHPSLRDHSVNACVSKLAGGTDGLVQVPSEDCGILCLKDTDEQVQESPGQRL